jgi:hypothetical protein
MWAPQQGFVGLFRGSVISFVQKDKEYHNWDSHSPAGLDWMPSKHD